MQRVASSFRDPSGQVFTEGNKIVRTIQSCYAAQWESVEPFLQKLVKQGHIPAYMPHAPLPGSWKSVEVKKIPFISYPYEWCYSQLKDAALLTLELYAEGLEEGLILKDASAYNIQFIGYHPVFIDLLSWERWIENTPWQGYGQFCRHFLAPLALIAHGDLRHGLLSRLWLDGIPLDLACKMLPWRTRFSLSLMFHLYLHARMQIQHGDGRKSEKIVRNTHITMQGLKDIAFSLHKAINLLILHEKKSEWSEYYTDTNYTDAAQQLKLSLVDRIGREHPGKLAVDLGANTGRYSSLLASSFETVIAADIDALAVEKHYHSLKNDKRYRNILPLVLDLGNPSPCIGWANEERESFTARCHADLVIALALVHHLVMTAGIPMQKIAEYMASLLVPGGRILFEFVPREDNQVQRLLAARDDIFEDYTIDTFKKSFQNFFVEEESQSLPESSRSLYIFRLRDRKEV